MPTLVLTDSQQVTLSAQAQDKHGHPAELDGPMTWASSDETIITVTPDSSDTTGGKAVAVAVGNIGTCQVSVNGTENGSPLTGTLDFQVTGGDAVSIGIQAGTPEEQPETPPEPTPTP